MRSRTLALPVAVAAVLLTASPAVAASTDDCAGKPVKTGRDGVPAQARHLFKVFSRAAHPVSAKRRQMICGAQDYIAPMPGQARRIASPMGTRGAWFLVPGRKGVLIDTGGGAAAAPYASIRSSGMVSYMVVGTKNEIIGAATDGYRTIVATGNDHDGNPVTFTAPIRHNVFYLPTPNSNATGLAVTLRR